MREDLVHFCACRLQEQHHFSKHESLRFARTVLQAKQEYYKLALAALPQANNDLWEDWSCS